MDTYLVAIQGLWIASSMVRVKNTIAYSIEFSGSTHVGECGQCPYREKHSKFSSIRFAFEHILSCTGNVCQPSWQIVVIAAFVLGL